MARRRLRFLRALALLAGAVDVGCDSEAVEHDVPTSGDAAEAASDVSFVDSSDVAVADTTNVDTASDFEDTARLDSFRQDFPLDALVEGSCKTFDWTETVLCAPGNVCVYPTEGALACKDAGEDVGVATKPCGSIRCATDFCICDATPSICWCTHGATGPLPPPDLA